MFPSSKILKDLAADVAGLYAGKDPGHDYTHIENLLRLVSCLAAEEKIDVELLTLMCLFHGLWDAARKPQAEALLRAHGYTDEQIVTLYQAIFAAAEERPESLEEALLHDANKLERLGAHGIARTWLITGYTGQDVASGLAYIRRNLETTQQMYTAQGQQLAAQRRQTVQDYLAAWVKEQV